MQKFVIIIVFLLSLSNTIKAQFFSVQANCNSNYRKGTCVAYNGFYRPIYCEGTIQGRTRLGFYTEGGQYGWVQPGQNFYMYVYSENPQYDPLIGTWGDVNCRF